MDAHAYLRTYVCTYVHVRICPYLVFTCSLPQPYPGSMEQSPGRIIYEKNSECFFVHFHSSGVDGDKPVHVGDEVSFLLAKDPV